MSSTHFLRNGIFREEKSLLDGRGWSRKSMAWQTQFAFFDDRFIPCLQSIIDPCQPWVPAGDPTPAPAERDNSLPHGSPCHQLIESSSHTPSKCWFRACLFIYVHNRPWYSHLSSCSSPCTTPQGICTRTLPKGPQWLHSSCLVLPGLWRPLQNVVLPVLMFQLLSDNSDFFLSIWARDFRHNGSAASRSPDYKTNTFKCSHITWERHKLWGTKWVWMMSWDTQARVLQATNLSAAPFFFCKGMWKPENKTCWSRSRIVLE